MTYYPSPKKHPTTVRDDREFDTTQLRAGVHARRVNRDYAAHFFRWGFALKFIDRTSTVLEIGCGQDCPLVGVMQGSLTSFPKRYLGIDLNKVQDKPRFQWCEIKDEFNFIARASEIQEKFDVCVCYEVIEHMDKDNGLKLLKAIRSKMKSSSVFILSTPVYNEKHMAANHIHEYRFAELEEHIKTAGLSVESVHGTFMSANAMKRACTKEELSILSELNEFYPWEVLANFLAPKYPQHASNCAWVLRVPHDF